MPVSSASLCDCTGERAVSEIEARVPTRYNETLIIVRDGIPLLSLFGSMICSIRRIRPGTLLAERKGKQTWKSFSEVSRFNLGDHRFFAQTIIIVTDAVDGLIACLSKSENSKCRVRVGSLRRPVMLTVQYPCWRELRLMYSNVCYEETA